MTRNQIRDEIKERISCTDYLQKSKRGQYICPFCGSGTGHNQSGALTYYKNTNTVYCHACGRSGDSLDLIQIAENVDYNRALEIGADKLGLNYAPTSPINGPQSDSKASKDKYIKEAEKTAQNGAERPTGANDFSEYYRECAKRLQESKAAISYLTARGISPDTAAACGVGFDPAADPADSGHKAARLILPTSRSHYVGRSIDPATPKAYSKLNPKGGSPGIFNAKALYAQEIQEIFVVEGAFDALSVIELQGQAIALSSANNGAKLLKQLQERPTDKAFIICFDNDKTPTTKQRVQQAAAGLCEDLQQAGYKAITFDISKYCCEGEKDLNDILQHDRSRAAAAIQDATTEIRKDELSRFFDKIQTEAYKPYKTEQPFFDELLGGGILRQTLLLLMAAPGTGKTTLCQQIAEAMAAHRKPVLYLCFEMSREQMLAKALSRRLAEAHKEYNTTDILQGYKWTLEQQSDIAQALADYRRDIYPYLQYNPSGASSDLDQLLSYLQEIGQQAKAEGREAPAVVVDYLHLISSKRGLDNQELIKQAVTGLKQYAIEYNTIVIAITATNRASNTAGRITLESGRDSSNIEYTADYQLSLNYYAIEKGEVKPEDQDKLDELKAEPYRRMLLRVLKSRFEQVGRTRNVYFNPRENRFYDGESGFIPEGAKLFVKSPSTGRRL